MGLRLWVFCIFFTWAYNIPLSHQLQSYQTQVLLQLRKHLEYPSQLQGWENYTADFCTMKMSPYVKISCQSNSVTELRIAGDKNAKTRLTNFSGFAISEQTLSESFSIDSFITTLTRLPDLKVVSLVSLGIWGPLSDKIHRLHSLELLDLSANYLYGNLPPKISVMTSLKSLTLDSNFFNDTIPDWWDSLSNLSIMSLKDNQLKGSFPSSIVHIANLTDLSLSGNKLSGGLPDLSSLYSLHLLDLRDNHFNSDLPTMPISLATVLMSSNFFTGVVPDQFGELLQLQHLDLSYNSLSGLPPVSLFSLPKFSYLNLASNKLSGSFYNQLKCGNVLGFVDISNNRMTGGLPSCLETTLGNRIVKCDGNCLSVGGKNQHEKSYCEEKRSAPILSLGKRKMFFIAAVVGIVILLVLLVLLSLILISRCKKQRKETEHRKLPRILHENPQTSLSADLLANARLISQAAKAASQGIPAYRIFSLEELQEATNGFDVSSFLGHGSTGKLHKGKLRNGTDVAIRSLCLHGKHSTQRLKMRLEQVSKLRHPHLVALLGHCLDTYSQDQCSASRIFLVYEYVPNGSFRSHLSETSPQRLLRWSERLVILVDAAKAVHFLHTGFVPGSFHNRLRANSILLDENGVAKLSDYGISIITEDVQKPEGKGDASKSWTKESLEDDDVYNFGFILLEALVGPIVAGNRDTLLLTGMTSFGSQDGRRKIVDPIVLTTSSQESLSTVISITNKCISTEASNRPSFEDVLWNLQYAAQVQSASDADQIFSDATTSFSNP